MEGSDAPNRESRGLIGRVPRPFLGGVVWVVGSPSVFLHGIRGEALGGGAGDFGLADA